MSAVLEFRRPRGRASLAVQQRDILKEERHALRAELREVGKLVPLAEYVRRRVAVDCDPQTEQAASTVVYYLERVARRHGGDAA